MKSKHPHPSTPAPAAAEGFTLIEMMVVMALISVVLVMSVAISNGSLATILQARTRMESDRIAGSAFDQIGSSIQQKIVRGEPTMRLIKHSLGTRGGNDELVLLSMRPGYALTTAEAERRASRIHFRIGDHAFQVASSGYKFPGTGERPDENAGSLELFGMPGDGPEELRDAWFEALAPGVLRMEFSILTRDKDEPVRADSAASGGTGRALVVTLVVLDPERSRMLDSDQLKEIARQFPDAVDGELPFRKWAEIARNLSSSSLAGSVARTPLQHAAVYQRSFALPDSFQR